MFLDGGRKPENPERTHAYTGRMCRLHTERPQPGVTKQTWFLKLTLRALFVKFVIHFLHQNLWTGSVIANMLLLRTESSVNGLERSGEPSLFTRHPNRPQSHLLTYHSQPAPGWMKEKIKRSKCQRGAECIPLTVSRERSPGTTCDPGTKLMTAGGHIKKFSS